jgi:hypothetical protein
MGDRARRTKLQVELGRVLAHSELHSRRSVTQPRGRVQDGLSEQHVFMANKIVQVVAVSALTTNVFQGLK